MRPTVISNNTRGHQSLKLACGPSAGEPISRLRGETSLRQQEAQWVATNRLHTEAGIAPPPACLAIAMCRANANPARSRALNLTWGSHQLVGAFGSTNVARNQDTLA